MSIKTIAAILTDEAADAPALEAALALAGREDAHLDATAVALEPMPVDAYTLGLAPVLIESARAETEDRARALAGWARARAEGVPRVAVGTAVLPGIGSVEALARLARHADLAVAARPYGRGRGPLAALVAEALLFGAGVPVLVVPDAGADLARPWGRICLAWNDGDEALRAARAALPFLRAARQVDVAIVDPPLHAPDRADPGGALALWLSRHGVRAEVALLARTEASVAGVLARFARERGAEAMVMGAYGHSRLREAVLGGATREMLSSVPLPLVLAR